MPLPGGKSPVPSPSGGGPGRGRPSQRYPMFIAALCAPRTGPEVKIARVEGFGRAQPSQEKPSSCRNMGNPGFPIPLLAGVASPLQREGLGGHSPPTALSKAPWGTRVPLPLPIRDYRSSKIATTRVHPALPPVSLTGKQATLNPVGRGSASRLASFSMWQYSRSRPTRCASQITAGSPVR